MIYFYIIHISVEAQDEETDPQKGYTNIKVKPLDINDNKPMFDEDPNRLTGEVYENTDPCEYFYFIHKLVFRWYVEKMRGECLVTLFVNVFLSYHFVFTPSWFTLVCE